MTNITELLIPREAWGAAPPRERRNAAGHLIDPYDPHNPARLVAHHSYLPDAAGFRGADSIGSIQRFHMGPKNGWVDIGYHFLVAPDGLAIYQGRPPDAIGAHCGGNTPAGTHRLFGNTGSVGICLIGDYDRETPSPQAILTLSALFEWLRVRYGKLPLYGHFQAWSKPPKTCPGKNLAEALGLGSEWRAAHGHSLR